LDYFFSSSYLESILSIFNARFFHQYFGAKKLQSQNETREKLLNLLLNENCVCKMLMKLTTGSISSILLPLANFTNILGAYLYRFPLAKNYKHKL